MSFFEQDVANVTLKRRELPDNVILAGQPQVRGRILDVNEDGRIACVAWRMTPGAISINPNPDVQDLLYVLEGRAQVRTSHGDPISLQPGAWIRMPREPYQLHVSETLKKISVLYNPNGLSMQAEAP